MWRDLQEGQWEGVEAHRDEEIDQEGVALPWEGCDKEESGEVLHSHASKSFDTPYVFYFERGVGCRSTFSCMGGNSVAR